ncbi:MAG: hypothetical protein KC503_22370 [Myxococcales bacterium]|nr:hypothetical protein [Myxococcales bacterium]
MPAELHIDDIQGIGKKGLLNHEWIALTNVGDAPFNTEGCSITTTSGGARPRVVTTMKAGVVIQPGEKVRLVSGSSGKKSHGDAPDDDYRNVFLFLKARYLDKTGLLVRISLGQHEVARTHYPKKETD